MTLGMILGVKDAWWQGRRVLSRTEGQAWRAQHGKSAPVPTWAAAAPYSPGEQSRHMWKMGTAIKENVAAACRRPLPHFSRRDTSCAQADGLSRQCPTIGCRPARTSSKARRPQQQRRATRRRPLLDGHPRGCLIVRNDPSKHPPMTEVTGGSMRAPRGCERPGGMAWAAARQNVELPP